MPLPAGNREYKRKDLLPKGVLKRGNKWAAWYSFKGIKTHLGTFNSLEEAIRVREEAFSNLPTDKTVCPSCQVEFEKQQKQQRFCSPKCKGSYKYVTSKVTTESQYKAISGNWDRYLSRFLYVAGRKRDKLSKEDLLKVLVEQDYKCAISGIPLTCKLEKGKRFWTNASVDRIVAGGPYTKNNIQLVCRAINSWRSDMPLEEFIQVCKAVTQHQERLEGKDGQA